nr:MarR family transcriptional regulator [Clostridium algifaecis]
MEQKYFKYTPFKDLTISEIHTIEAIGIYKPRMMKEIAFGLDITFGTLTTAINRLVKKQYVIRKRSDIDRRIVYIELTKKGKLVYRIHKKFHFDMVNESVKGLDKDEETILISSLEKLNDFFKSKYNIKVK